MSNPTTLVESFPGTHGSFSLTGPERYSAGLWLEEGGTNKFTNPVMGTTADWTGSGGFTITRVTTFPALPDWLVGRVTTATKITSSADNSSALFFIISNAINPTLTAAQHVAQIYLYIPSGFAPTQLRFMTDTSQFTSATGIVAADANMALTDQWQLVGPVKLTPNAGDLTGAMYLTKPSGQGTWANGTFVYLAVADIKAGSYLTSPVSGGMGTGYAWDGTADASPSTRAASSAAISPSGILSPSSGALAFRITPTIETGLEELWGECGVKGSGTDHVRWGRDASKHPFVEWSANNAAYQRLTGSETLNALTAYDLYLGHSATTISLAVDAGTLQTGTRDAVSASWSAGNLTLEATAGGVVYNQLATFNRTLSASEIKTLDRRTSWSRTMFGNPFAYFQLRPY